MGVKNASEILEKEKKTSSLTNAIGAYFKISKINCLHFIMNVKSLGLMLTFKWSIVSIGQMILT